jgi:hypothetical protein
VGITPCYGLDGPGIKSWWGQDFPHRSRLALGPTQPPIQWVPGLSGGVKRPGRGVGHPPPSNAEVEGRVEPPPLGLRDLFQGELYLLPCSVYSQQGNIPFGKFLLHLRGINLVVCDKVLHTKHKQNLLTWICLMAGG